MQQETTIKEIVVTPGMVYGEVSRFMNFDLEDMPLLLEQMDKLYPETYENILLPHVIGKGFKQRLVNWAHRKAANPFKLSNDELEKLTFIFKNCP